MYACACICLHLFAYVYYMGFICVLCLGIVFKNEQV